MANSAARPAIQKALVTFDIVVTTLAALNVSVTWLAVLLWVWAGLAVFGLIYG